MPGMYGVTWRIDYLKSASRDLARLDPAVRKRIRRFLHERLAHMEDPRQLGKRLQGQKDEFWRFRVGHYRLVCTIEDGHMIVLVVRVGHRREVYRG